MWDKMFFLLRYRGRRKMRRRGDEDEGLSSASQHTDPSGSMFLVLVST